MQKLVAEMAEALSVSASPLEDAVALVERKVPADRVSLVRFEEDGASFRVLATAGVELCSPGTSLPIATSSHYCENFEGRRFARTHLDHDRGFDRSSDQLMLWRGFRSTCSAPLVRGRETLGALNLSSMSPDVRLEDTAEALEGVRGMLSLALTGSVTRRGPHVLVCADDPVYGLGLGRLCEGAGASASSVSASIDGALGTIDTEVPGVVLCDSYLGGVRVDEVMARLRAAGVGAPLVIVASHDTPENARTAIRAGAAGYLPRHSAPSTLAAVLASVCAGRSVLPAVEEGDAEEPLTAREREVLRGLDDGLRIKQFAVTLGISESTAKNHVRNIFRKLGASSRTEALREARRQGLLA